MKSTGKPFLLWPLAAAFALFSAVAGTGALYGADVFLIRAAQSRPSGLLDAVSGFFSAIGSWELTGGLLLAFAAGLFVFGRRRLAGRLLLAFVAAGLLEYLLKTFLPVPPVPGSFLRVEDFAPLTPAAAVHPPYPYPSGHVLRSVVLLGAVYLLSRSGPLRAAIALALLALAMSRVYLGTHWTSDVVGGALLGIIALAWAFGKEESRWR